MSIKWRSPMKNAISEVLEKMFYLTVIFDDMPASAQHYPHECGIEILRNGEPIIVCFRVTGGFARSITANLLGMREADITPQDVEDTLKEWANMVAGNFQHRMDIEWRLGIPFYKEFQVSTDRDEEGVFFSSLGEEMGVAFLHH